MSVEFYSESPGKFDSRTLNRETLSSWTGRSIGRPAPGPDTGPAPGLGIVKFAACSVGLCLCYRLCVLVVMCKRHNISTYESPHLLPIGLDRPFGAFSGHENAAAVLPTGVSGVGVLALGVFQGEPLV